MGWGRNGSGIVTVWDHIPRLHFTKIFVGGCQDHLAEGQSGMVSTILVLLTGRRR